MPQPSIRTLLESHPLLHFVRSFLSQNKEAELYFVGGAVRDALLARPTKDFDFVVKEMEPEALRAWLEARGTVDFVGRDFGVFKFLPSGFSPKEHEFVDIALPRTEHTLAGSLGGYREFEVKTDIHLPLEQDLARRDFTMNALAYNCRTRELLDPFGGVEDIAHRRIRAVGTASERFDEDLSRILRAIRFSSELLFEIEAETWQALKDRMGDLHATRTRENAETEFVIPRETLGKELATALHAHSANTLALFKDADALGVLIPEIKDALEKDAAYLSPLLSLCPLNVTVATAVLLRALEPEKAAQTVRSLGLHTLAKESELRVEPEHVSWMITQIQRPETLDALVQAPGSKFEMLFMNGRASYFIPFLSMIGRQDLVDRALARKEQILKTWNVRQHKHIPKLISGDDILALGIQSGPRVRELINLVRDGQLDGTLMRREQALSFLKDEQSRVDNAPASV